LEKIFEKRDKFCNDKRYLIENWRIIAAGFQHRCKYWFIAEDERIVPESVQDKKQKEKQETRRRDLEKARMSLRRLLPSLRIRRLAELAH